MRNFLIHFLNISYENTRENISFQINVLTYLLDKINQLSSAYVK